MKTCKNQITVAISLISLAILVGLSGCHKTHQAPAVPSVRPAIPPNKFDLKGLFLGMKEEEAKAAVDENVSCISNPSKTPGMSCYADTLCYIEKMRVAGKKTKFTTLMIKDNQVTVMNIVFPTDDFINIAEALTGQYGKPKDIKKDKVTNRFGASFGTAKLTWKIKDAIVTLTNIDGKVDEGSLLIEAAKKNSQVEECMLNAKKAANNDL